MGEGSWEGTREDMSWAELAETQEIQGWTEPAETQEIQEHMLILIQTSLLGPS